MSFQNYLSQAWSAHGDEPDRVAAEFAQGVGLISKPEEIPDMAGLITHVAGVHLADWNAGVKILKTLRGLPFFTAESEADQAIARSIAALQLAAGETNAFSHFLPSDQVRILCVASAALFDKDTRRASELFEHALELAEKLDSIDPANRALAVTANNLASSLEEKESRSAAELSLMLLAAQTARKYWERAGTWKQVGYAEYRLAMSHLKAGDGLTAARHARLALDTFVANSAGPVEMFYGHEIVARTGGDGRDEAQRLFHLLTPEDQKWCRPLLETLS